MRSSNTLTRPSRSPSTCTAPTVGCSSADASRSSVVLPAPFGPSTTQRSSSSTAQLTWRNSIEPHRRTPTPSIRRTRSVRSGWSFSAVDPAVNNDSDDDPGATTSPILADRAGLPVGCPRRIRRSALRRRLDQRRRRRSVPGRRAGPGAVRTPDRADRADLRRLARPRARHRPRSALRLPGARAVPAVGRAAGQPGQDPRRPLRPPDHRTGHRSGRRPRAGWTTR